MRFLPAHLWALLALYTASSLAHFAHNAEFIAFYPNMPAWLSREKVYLAWLGVASVGAAGILVARFGWPPLGALLLGAYGALGLDGLQLYALALCSEHTLAANVTIWLDVGSGVALATAAALLLGRRVNIHLSQSS